MLLSQVHRLRALLLLARFLDMGSWAVGPRLPPESAGPAHTPRRAHDLLTSPTARKRGARAGAARRT